MNRTSRKPDQQGFLLIEVLFAATLLALVVAVAAGSLASSYRSLSASRKLTNASLLLESKLTELRDTGVDAPAAGAFDEDHPEFTWRAGAADGACAESLCPVTLAVLWKHRGAVRDVSVTTMLPAARAAAGEQP